MRRVTPACAWASVLVVVALSGCSGQAPDAAGKREVRVAAAADLRFALDAVVDAFQRGHPAFQVAVSYGSSGNFFAQLSNQAPFDVFLSADMEYPRRLIEAGLASKDSLCVYAIGHVVVWVRRESALDVEHQGLRTLLDPSVRKVAIANPKYAPYGRAAEAALKGTMVDGVSLYERIRERLVLGDNVAQTAQFVESGAADVGLLAQSLALSPTLRDKGRFAEVPTETYPRLEQGGVILSWARDREAAEALRAFLIGDEGRAILQGFGFALPAR
jgi:molybdate transport system substrate-binding protein